VKKIVLNLLGVCIFCLIFLFSFQGHNWSNLCNAMGIMFFNADQITGSLEVASNALLQVILRLKANIFGRDGALTTFPPALPYIPVSLDTSDGPKYGSRDRQSRGHGYSSSSSGYGSHDVNPSDNYGSNGGPLVCLSLHSVCVEGTYFWILMDW
jgi:hypothetical protein